VFTGQGEDLGQLMLQKAGMLCGLFHQNMLWKSKKYHMPNMTSFIAKLIIPLIGTV
jgi:hypothetical protein